MWRSCCTARGPLREGNMVRMIRTLVSVGVLGGLVAVAAAQPEEPPPVPVSEEAPPAPAPTPVNDGTTSTTVTAPLPTTNGRIRGRVVDKTGEPVPGAVITMVGSTVSAISDADGTFELLDVPAGAQMMQIDATGHAPSQSRATVTAGHTMSMVVNLTDAQLPGEEIVVTGSRLPEKRLDAPVTIEIVSEKDLQTAAGTSYLNALSRVKGIDYSDSGIGDARISARGFATQFNSRMLTMVDGRLAQLPGNGLPMGSLLPTSGLDMKAVEVVIGPASALYGPNAHTGVINIVTKTPWDDSGATVLVKGGTRSLMNGAARVAGTVNDSFGYKLNGEFLRANDFTPSRGAGTHDFGTTVFEGDLLSNYDVRSAKTDGTLYYKRGEWLTSAGAGYSDTTGFSITNSGRNHLRNWGVQYQTAQVSGPHVYAQVTRTASDAGKSYQLDRLARTVAAMGDAPANPAELDPIRDQIAFIDKSSMFDSELQLRYNLAGVKTTFGGQARHYLPSSQGTFLDDKDQKIGVTEAGSYVQLDTTVVSKLRLAAAARVDHHSQFGTQFSPKAAVQYEVAPSHNIRLGYNRAFKSPTILEDYLKINDVLLGNRTGFVIKDMSGNVVSEIAPLKPEKVDALELGYKGAIGDKIYIDAVAYQSWYREFISALTKVADPTAMNPTFASYADGTPVAAGTPAEGTLSTYQNFGRATIRGADVGVDYRPIPELTLSGSASVLSLVSFENTSSQNDLRLNAPKYKLRGSVQTEDLGLKNSFLRVDGRFHTAYAFESGYWNSMALLGGDIPNRFVLDVSAGYKFAKYGVTVTGTVANVLDDKTIDVLGAPTPRRLAWLQVSYDIDGLKY